MRFGTIFTLAAGFGLRSMSASLELRGDLAPAPADRLFLHSAALVVLLAAMACFARVVWVSVRPLFGYKASSPADVAKVFGDDPPAAFDAEGALERHAARKRAQAQRPSEPKPGMAAPAPRTGPTSPGGGFGRKGL